VDGYNVSSAFDVDDEARRSLDRLVSDDRWVGVCKAEGERRWVSAKLKVNEGGCVGQIGELSVSRH
jgi:hypothetical protein